MEISASMFFGILGITLAIVETWRPSLSVALEAAISKQIREVEEFQSLFIKEYRTISKVALGAFKELEKGPQILTPDEFKAHTLTSLTNIRSYLWFYWITAVNFLVLRPLRFCLMVLNKAGRGSAVGGLGILIGVLSTFL